MVKAEAEVTEITRLFKVSVLKPTQAWTQEVLTHHPGLIVGENKADQTWK